VVAFKPCSKNSIPCKTLVAMATARKNYKKNVLENLELRYFV
jgi:hypothetical protein